MQTFNHGRAPLEDLDKKIAIFERDNPDFIAELEILGMQIADYHRLVAETDSPVIVSDNSGGYLQ